MNKIIVGVAASVITSMVFTDILVSVFTTPKRIKNKRAIDLDTKRLAALDIKIAKCKEVQAELKRERQSAQSAV